MDAHHIMSRIKEKLTGGLVTVRDSALLEPGQLSASRNCVLKFGTDALHRSPGRTAFGSATASATNVDGLRDIKFDNGNHYLVAHASASYVSAAVGDSGTFGVLASGIGDGSQLEVVHYRNRFFLFNGTSGVASGLGSNRVAYLTATAAANVPTLRQHGMLAVKSDLASTTAAGSFSLANDGNGATGYYEYWSTEVAKITADGAEFVMESAFDGKPKTVFVSTTAVVPTLTFPAPINSISTHYRLYRSTKKAREADVAFPIGFMISETGIASAATATAQITVQDTLTVTATSDTLPGTSNTSQFYSDAGTPDNVFGAGYATLQTGAFNPDPRLDASSKRQAWYNFNLGAFRGSVKGIEVIIVAKVDTAPVQATVTLGANRRAQDGDWAYNASPAETPQKIAAKAFTITSTSDTTYTVGSASDAWRASNNSQFVDTDFNTDFMVMVRVSGSTRLVSIDSLKLRVSYAATVDPINPYPTVVYEFSGDRVQVARNGVPPSSSTGDIYEDTLVVNDVSNPGIIRYSYPGDPEAFPGTYYLDFETRENDAVTLVKTVNNKLVVGLSTSIWRANYLPSERDASFDRGKAIEPISRNFGVVNPMCACIYSPTGGPELLAFVSQKGIFSTNGYSLTELTENLDWRGILPTSSTSRAISLIDDPENRCLRFQYRNDANGSETYLELWLNYDGRVSGPTHMRNHAGGQFASLESAWSIRRSGGGTSIVYGYGSATAAGGGMVYIESGTSIPSLDSTMGFVTRRMYLADMSNEWTLGELYGYAGSYTGTPALTFVVEKTKTNDTGPSTGGSKSITLAGQRFFKAGVFREMGEGMRVSASVTASAYQQEMLVIDGDGWNEEDAGRS